MTLTEMLKGHRALWEWLSKHPDKKKSDWPEWDGNGGRYPDCWNECFACEYNEDGCDHCPFDWGTDANGTPKECIASIFNDWEKSITPVRAKYAQNIRDLSLKPEYQALLPEATVCRSLKNEVEKLLMDSHLGRGDAIKSADIAKELGVTEGGSTFSKIRKAIRELIDEGIPIDGCGDGYYVICTDQEFGAAADRLLKRITGISQRLINMREAYNNMQAETAANGG